MKRILSKVMVLALMVSQLLVFCSFNALAYSGYDYTSNTAVAETLTGIMNGNISIFDSENGYAVGASIGQDRHSFGGTYGWTCWAYANAVFYKLFGYVPEQAGTNVVSIVGSTSTSYQSFLNAGVNCGTYMRTEGNGGHSIIILSYNDSTVTFLDANQASDGVIKVSTWYWSTFNGSNGYVTYKGRHLSRVIVPSYETSNATTLQFSNISYPSQFKIDTTYGWHLQGGSVASNVDLTSIRSILSKNDGSWSQDTGDVGISGKYYSINTINTSVKFSQITTAGNYTWTLIAKDSSGRTLEMNMPFTAVASGSTATSTMSKEYVDVIRGTEMLSGHDQPIADGDYLIVSVVNNKYYLDIEGVECPASNGTNVSLCGELTGKANGYDLWTVNYIGNGFYSIKQKGANVSLDVANASDVSGTNIQAHSANDSSAQKWAISTHPLGGYRIQAKCSGFSLDVTGASIANGTNIQQHENNDSEAQAWAFIRYDLEKPTISDVKVTDITSDGYTVTCTVNDNVGVTRVQFPTWYDGQQGEDATWHEGTISGDTATCYIKVSEHDNKVGLNYHTDIYAWDASDNRSEPAHARNNFVPDPTINVEKVELSKSNLIMSIGSVSALTATVSPFEATDKSLTWTISDKSVATVTNGKVIAVGCGYAKIGCTASNGIEAYCNIVVHADSILELPGALTTIESEAFIGAAIQDVIVPNGVQTIGSKAFANCASLKMISLPTTLTSIASDAFTGSKNVVILCKKPCKASEFAGANGIAYVILGS